MRTHGLSTSSEYKSWTSMKSRCLNPKHTFFCDYGGRGITICSRWLDFSLFLEDMGNKPSSKHTIERRNVNENYEPGNCIWATRSVQMKNRRPFHDKVPRVVSYRRELTDEQADRIRKAEGGYGLLTSLARQFGVLKQTIWQIRNAKTYTRRAA